LFVASRIEKAFGMRLDVEGVDGSLFGSLGLKGVSIAGIPGDEESHVFLAERVTFEYNWLDFFRKRFSGTVKIVLKKPVFYADVPFQPQATESGSLKLFAGVVEHVKEKTLLVIENGMIAWSGREGVLSEINGTIEDQAFDLELSLNHLRWGRHDVSTRLFLKGRLETDPEDSRQRLVGDIRTDRTIVNWTPVPKESSFRFTLMSGERGVHDAVILGGFEVGGKLFHHSPVEIHFNVQAERYPLVLLNPLLGRGPGRGLSGELDLSLEISGALGQPMLKGWALITGSQMGGSAF